MGTIEQIRPDKIYSHATYRFLLLENQHSSHTTPTPTVRLNHISLLKFIHVYDRLNECQQHIHDDLRKIFTLFLSNQSIIEWNDNIHVIDDNIHQVHIFCYSYSEFLEMKKWRGCYRTQIQGVYLPDNFEYQLLRLGVDHINRILPEFQTDQNAGKELRAHARKLLQAMITYYQNELDDSDDEEGVECT